MNCPYCHRNLTLVEASRSRCPHCGRHFDRTALGVVKTGTIRVAAGDADQVYHSLEELPPPLREQLQQALGKPETETILIADEQGREQIFQIIKGLPPEAQKKILAALRFSDRPRPSLARIWRVVLFSLALLVLAALLWFVWGR